VLTMPTKVVEVVAISGEQRYFEPFECGAVLGCAVPLAAGPRPFLRLTMRSEARRSELRSLFPVLIQMLGGRARMLAFADVRKSRPVAFSCERSGLGVMRLVSDSEDSSTSLWLAVRALAGLLTCPLRDRTHRELVAGRANVLDTEQDRPPMLATTIACASSPDSHRTTRRVRDIGPRVFELSTWSKLSFCISSSTW